MQKLSQASCEDFSAASRRLDALLREFLEAADLRSEHWQGGTLCKGGSYAQFTGEQIKIKWVIVARTACSLYGSSAPVKVVRGGDGRCAPAFLCWRLHR